MSTEAIERETLIEAPAEVVWDVITRPEQVSRWFGDVVEIDLRVGGSATFTFTEHGDSIEAEIVRVDRPRAFAWRWIHVDPGADGELGEAHSTHVEFTLAEEGDKTRLRVVESGFDAVEWPPERDAAQVRADHVEGWELHLGEVAGLFGSREGVRS